MKPAAWMTPARAFAAAAAILILVGTYVALSALDFTRDLHWVTHSYQVIARLERIGALEHAAVTAQRTHLLTGDRDHFNAFWENSAESKAEAVALGAMVSDNPGQFARASQLETLLRQRMDTLAGILSVYRTQGLEAARAQIGGGPGLKVQADFDGLLDAALAQERQLLESRTDAMQRSLRWLIATAALGIAASLLILWIAYRLLARENRERLLAERRVTDANRELGYSVSRLERLSTDLAALGSYAGMLQSSVGIPEAMEITRQALQGLLPELSGSVYYLRASKDHADCIAAWGEPPLASEAMPAPGDCWCLRRSQVYAVDDARAGVRCAHVGAPKDGAAAAYACIPLAAQGETMGWLHLSGPGLGPLPGLSLAVNASEQLSLALANLRLKEALRNQAIRDPLTGLFNRRYLEESLAREFARCRRRKMPLSVLMLDVDHFKAFNDANGHTGGDVLLGAFGGLLQAHSRSEDIACRYGGEEFTLILPEAPAQVAREKAEEIRLAVAEMVVHLRGQDLPKVTVSLGLATFPDHGGEATALLALADKALYEAKAGGRNRVAVAPLIPS